MDQPAGIMIIANRLDDGRVVFLAATDRGAGRWVESIAAGSLAGPDAAAGLLALAATPGLARDVIAPEAIEVIERAGLREPVAWRDAIRAGGPTIRTDRAGTAGARHAA